MSIGMEICIGDGKTKPKVVKTPGGDWVVRATLPTAHAKYSRALWAKSCILGEPVYKDGKGLLVTPAGKLSQG